MIRRAHEHCAELSRALLDALERHVSALEAADVTPRRRRKFVDVLLALASPTLPDASLPTFILLAHHPFIGAYVFCNFVILFISFAARGARLQACVGASQA